MVQVSCIELLWDAIRAKPEFSGLNVEFRGNWKEATSGPPYNDGRIMSDWPLLASYTLPQLECKSMTSNTTILFYRTQQRFEFIA
jgi:hypothetical protein